MNQSFDAVFVGSGINCLAAALHLAARGWKVAVYEQAGEPGGAVKSGAYTAPGFRHDWAAMNLSLFAGSPFMKVYGGELTAAGLAFAPVADPFASVFPDGKWFGVSTDVAVTTKRIAAFSGKDAETWGRLLAAFPGEAQFLFALLGSPMTNRALAGFAWKLVRARKVSGAYDLIRFLLASPRQWLTETFESEHIRATLGAWGMHLDFAPDIAGGALFPYLEAMANQSFGMVLGKGGADTVTNALVAAIRKRGGSVCCNTPVRRIIHKGGKANGVELADGTVITAWRAVIAGVAPRGLLRLTGASGTAGFDKSMAGFSHAPGTMMIHVAANSLPDWSAGAELKKFAYIHLAPSLDQMARTYQQAKAGLLPDEPVIVVGQPTAIDPSRAPDGKHVLWLQVRMAPGRIKGDAKGEIAATDWAGATEPFAERVLSIVERYAPGFKASIIASRFVSPAELEADNPNLVEGDQLGGSHHLAQHFLFRPTRGHADGSTALKDLYLTGASVWPGAGTGAGAGHLLARKLAGG